ncbi:MAG: tRNA (guanosine(46)-N7)-methyltransferase TrmB [Oscillospiraceae bacterium]|nr:tRNA (guanosine(46)-N7)-methyltransferase TrmB [Oscillospiraceae bacterium]
MRLRKPKNFDKRWKAVAPQYLIVNFTEKNIGGNNTLLRLEFGCGRGNYLTAQAAKFPDVLHVGVERNQPALLKAMEMAHRAGLDNIKFIDGDVQDITEWFADGTINRLDILFCDPWLKDRYAKRRLTHRNFLAAYHRLLKADGLLCVRTDNVPLFEFTLEELEQCGGWKIASQTRDLHGRGGAVAQIDTAESMTGYEEKFTALGVPICEVKVLKREDLGIYC